MKKSDSEIQNNVIDELEWEPSVSHEHIGVAVEQGVVTLSGSVPSYQEKFNAEDAAQRVAGVKAVVEKIEVKLPGASVSDDLDLATNIINQFKWNSQINEDKIKVSVEKGWVRLKGEVLWEYQKRAAEKVIRGLKGIKGVTNNILVKPSVQPTDVKLKIEQALKRSAEREARKIEVKVEGSRVIISGSVKSFAERKAVEAAAWGAPGVTEVEEHLQISA